MRIVDFKPLALEDWIRIIQRSFCCVLLHETYEAEALVDSSFLIEHHIRVGDGTELKRLRTLAEKSQ